MCFTTDDGSSITLVIDLKVFQELRKCLSYHIKKIMDNEAVSLLK
jgi:hypothetical protein